jgi:Putative Flp pilus-assembly TadE/G-like
VLAVLSMSLLLGFMALAVDVGVLFRAKRNVQIAADAAAIAAALDYKYNGQFNGSTATAYAAANAAAMANGYTSGIAVACPNGSATVNRSTTIAVTLCIPPAGGPNAGRAGFAEATVSAPNPTYFMSLFNYNGITVGGRAVAGPGTTENCVYVLGTGGAEFQNSGTLSLTNCGLIVNSNDPGAYSNSGTVNALSIGVAGGLTGGGANTPTPATGIAPSGNPLNLTPPSTSGCNPLLTLSSSTTVSPGCYSGLTIGSGANVTFSDGNGCANGCLYVINGPINIASGVTLTGTGVTFYFKNTIAMDPSTNMQLSAPTSGAWNGILLYEDSSDTNSLPIQGASGSSLQGIIYAPSATVDLSNAAGMSLCTALVVNQLTNNPPTNNASSITLQDYQQANSSSPLRTITLVE